MSFEHASYRRLCDGVMVYSRREGAPGVRQYDHMSTAGWKVATTRTDGAVVLYDAIERLYRERLPQGTHAEHIKRAQMIARALSDGAYLAVHRLDAVFHLSTGTKDSPDYERLRRAHDVAQLDYHRLRDYLHEDEGVPYVDACIVAAQFTHYPIK